MTNKDLIIKVNFEIEGQPRVNTLRLHINNDDSLIVHVENGRHNGISKYGRIRLDKDMQKQLIEFVQCSIK